MMFDLFNRTKSKGRTKPKGRTKSITHQLNLVHQVSFDDVVYDIEIRRRRNARRLTLRVRGDKIFLTMPLHTSLNDAEAFIRRNRNWIDEQFRKEAAAFTFSETGAPLVYFRGVPVAVLLKRNPNHQGKAAIEATDSSLTICLTPKSRIKPSRVLENWLRAEAKAALAAEVDTILPQIYPLLAQTKRKPVVTIAVRDQKTRWGSCSSTGKLSFNWRLIMAPEEALRYVAVHEVAHLVHLNHSPAFWGLVEAMMPDYRDHQRWLRSNQAVLFASLDKHLAFEDKKSDMVGATGIEPVTPTMST